MAVAQVRYDSLVVGSAFTLRHQITAITATDITVNLVDATGAVEGNYTIQGPTGTTISGYISAAPEAFLVDPHAIIPRVGDHLVNQATGVTVVVQWASPSGTFSNSASGFPAYLPDGWLYSAV